MKPTNIATCLRRREERLARCAQNIARFTYSEFAIIGIAFHPESREKKRQEISANVEIGTVIGLKSYDKLLV